MARRKWRSNEGLSVFFYFWFVNYSIAQFDLNGARKEAKNCIDILAQAPQFVARAKKIDDEENQFTFSVNHILTPFNCSIRPHQNAINLRERET